MGKKKGLSLDEKRDRILQLYYDKVSAYTTTNHYIPVLKNNGGEIEFCTKIDQFFSLHLIISRNFCGLGHMLDARFIFNRP